MSGGYLWRSPGHGDIAALNRVLHRPVVSEDAAFEYPDWTLMMVAGAWQQSQNPQIVCLGDLLHALAELDNFGAIPIMCLRPDDIELGAAELYEHCCEIDQYLRAGPEHLDTAAGMIADLYEQFADELAPNEASTPAYAYEYVELWRDRAAGFRSGVRPGGYWTPEQRAVWFDIRATDPTLADKLTAIGLLQNA